MIQRRQEVCPVIVHQQILQSQGPCYAVIHGNDGRDRGQHDYVFQTSLQSAVLLLLLFDKRMSIRIEHGHRSGAECRRHLRPDAEGMKPLSASAATSSAAPRRSVMKAVTGLSLLTG